MLRSLRLSPLIALGFSRASAAPANAQDWPSRPVNVLVPFGAGGNTDMMARLAAQRLASKFGQTLWSRTGRARAGRLATGAVATAAPDGYTLLFSASSVAVLTPHCRS